MAAPAAAAPKQPSISGPPATLAQVQQYVNAHPTELGGMYVDSTTRQVFLNLPPTAEQANENAVGSMLATPQADGWRLELRRVQYTTAQLARVMSDITTAQPWASQSKKVLATWGVNARLDRVLVGVTTLTPQLRQAAARAFGDAVVLVQAQRPQFAEQVTKVHGAVKTVTARPGSRADSPNATNGGALPDAAPPYPSRQTDVQPYFGGDRIYRLFVDSNGVTEIFQCTVAYEWSSTQDWMSTAGHCGPTGTIWNQGYYDPSSNTLYNTGYMGRNYAVQWGDNEIDGALMDNYQNNASWSPYIYTQLQSGLSVVGMVSSLAEGEDVCFDGSTTNENCSGILSQVNICTEISDPATGDIYNVCGIDVANSSNDTVISQPGDSGGPVYQYLNNNANAAGIISAESNNGTEGLFTDLPRFRQQFGGSVVTP